MTTLGSDMKSQVERKTVKFHISKRSGHQSHYCVRLHDKGRLRDDPPEQGQVEMRVYM